MSVQFGKISANVFANSTATYENGIVKITTPVNAERVNFYAPANFNYADVYTVNEKQVRLSNLTNNQPIMKWVAGAPVSAVYDESEGILYLNTIFGENKIPSSIFANSTAVVDSGGGVSITTPEGYEQICFYAPAKFNPEATYTVNGTPAILKSLTGEPVAGGWGQDAPVSLIYHDGILWYNGISGEGGVYIPSTLPELNPDFTYTRNGTNITVSASTQVVREETDPLASGVWVYNKTVPQTPDDGNVKIWEASELISNTTVATDACVLNDLPISSMGYPVKIRIQENNSAYKNYLFLSKLWNNQSVGVLMREEVSTETGAYGADGTPYFGSTLDNNMIAFENRFTTAVKGALKNIQVVIGHGAVPKTDKRKIISPTLRMITGGTEGNETDAQFTYFMNDDNSTKIASNGTANVSYWLSTDGNQLSAQMGRAINNKGELIYQARNSSIGMRPVIFVDLNATINEETNGTYTLVGFDSAKITYEITDWPESDPFYIRQFTLNQDGQYQSALAGAVAVEVKPEPTTPPTQVHDYIYPTEMVVNDYEVELYFDLPSNNQAVYKYCYIGYADGETGNMTFMDCSSQLDWSAENGDMDYQEVHIKDVSALREFGGNFCTGILTNETFDVTATHHITEFSTVGSSCTSRWLCFNHATVGSPSAGVNDKIYMSGLYVNGHKETSTDLLSEVFYISNTQSFTNYVKIDTTVESVRNQLMNPEGLSFNLPGNFDGYYYIKRSLGGYSPITIARPAVADWNEIEKRYNVTNYPAPLVENDRQISFSNGTTVYMTETYKKTNQNPPIDCPFFQLVPRGRYIRGTSNGTVNGKHTIVAGPGSILPTTGGGVDPHKEALVVCGKDKAFADWNYDDTGDNRIWKPVGYDYGNPVTRICYHSSFATLDFTNLKTAEL